MAFGLVYGVAARFLFERNEMGSWFATMTCSFLTLVPLAMGFLTVRAHPNPSLRYRLLAPWIPITLTVLVSWAVGWEGAICIVMAYPILLITGSFGGLLGGWSRLRPVAPAGALILIPWLLAPVEARWHPGPTVREVETAITIRAPAEVVWRNVIEVPSIAPAELRPALFTRMGFPRPISATLTGTGVGAIRHARFAGGVLFVETVTDWVPEHRLSFIIRAQTDSIPPSTLDPHVTIGGEYFDALSGTYELEEVSDGVRLILKSTHRLSTRFNFYSGLWSDAVMRSIQRNILEVLAARCETQAGGGTVARTRLVRHIRGGG
jgi:hypothetical protein